MRQTDLRGLNPPKSDGKKGLFFGVGQGGKEKGKGKRKRKRKRKKEKRKEARSARALRAMNPQTQRKSETTAPQMPEVSALGDRAPRV
jgi:hypothetical protein